MQQNCRSWWWLIVAIVIGRLFSDRLAKQLELAQINVTVLKRQLANGSKRPRPTQREKRRLAELAKAPGRSTLVAMRESLIVTPDTLMRWWRKLCAATYDSSRAQNRD